ncbi:hypothetical protein [Streptomyces sparsogenes]|uniref:hypothetical protein n=1 Tax=Streptomyces sparsogenes TaxID=67365 RepID=UPI000978F6B2|nr:hypothetical protein [Streptomyces sparsogenes]
MAGGARLREPGAAARGDRRGGVAVAACLSGIELAEGGFAEDVAIAVELNASGLVPVLTEGTFDASPEKWRGNGGR